MAFSEVLIPPTSSLLETITAELEYSDIPLSAKEEVNALVADDSAYSASTSIVDRMARLVLISAMVGFLSIF